MNELAVVHPDGLMMSRFEAARQALAEARRVDEVKDIVDRSAALQEYARRAKDTQMLEDATELRFDAERKGGAMLAGIEKNKGVVARDKKGETRGSSGIPRVDEPPKLSAMGVTKTQSSKWQKLAALTVEKFKVRVEHAKARVKGMTTSAPSYSKAEYTGENEWFTPADWIERARVALGDIDLDPASHALAQATVRAKTFFTAADNGLEQEWFGRVWLNPPYSRALLAPFVAKMVEEWSSGRVAQAILLTHNYTDTEWFHAAAGAAAAICFPRGRIRFLSPAGDVCAPTQGQAIFYFGETDESFCRTFGEIGLVVRPV